MVKTKRFYAIVLTVLSVLCLNLSIIGFGSVIKDELKYYNDLSDTIMNYFELGSMSAFEFMAETLEDANENSTVKKVEAVAESVENSSDAILSGSLSLLDIRSICLIPGDVLDVAVDASIIMGADKDDINDQLADAYESNWILIMAKVVATVIFVYIALMVLCAIFNILSMLLNRRGMTWLLVVFWAILTFLMLSLFLLVYMDEGDYFAIQFGPILGLALAIAARVIWKKEYRALAASGADMEQSWNRVVDTAKVVGAQASAKVTQATASTPQPVPAATTCTSCGNPVTADKAFCSNCGTPVAPPAPPKVFCANCGAERDPSNAFCGSCGTKADT